MVRDRHHQQQAIGTQLRIAVILLTCLATLLVLRWKSAANWGSSKDKMWVIKQFESISGGTVRKYRALSDHATLTQMDAFRLMAAEDPSGEAFRESLRTTLLDQDDKEAFFLECPPCTAETAMTSPFEFVIVPAPGLVGVSADRESFKGKYSSECTFATFLNLGKDAMLVSPAPCAERDYAHLARFIRNAPAEHGRDLFLHVGKAVLGNIADKPMWLSTSGGGISWLHVRLDQTPKYYSFRPYKQWPYSRAY